MSLAPPISELLFGDSPRAIVIIVLPIQPDIFGEGQTPWSVETLLAPNQKSYLLAKAKTDNTDFLKLDLSAMVLDRTHRQLIQQHL